MAEGDETRDCYRCGKKGHLAINCRAQLPDGKGGQPGAWKPPGKGNSASAKNRRKLQAKLKEAEAKWAEAGITGGAANTEPDKGSETEFGFSAVCEEIATESIQMSVVVTAILFCVTSLNAVCDIGFFTVARQCSAVRN